MKSIMHNKADQTCYLCMMLHGDYSRKTVQEHHTIFGSGRRKGGNKCKMNTNSISISGNMLINTVLPIKSA